ncbi:MAG: hypothetical protein LUH11_04125 [Candidatus Gastranaerophilales bacterium]|nr:hypothetical protein [Candidatus Gastranaerophilales bacterium]
MTEKGIEVPAIEDFSEQLINVSKEMKELAFAYYEARKEYAKCLNKITVMIYKAGLHESKAAFENKIPMLFANTVYSDLAIETSAKMNEARQEYKGLEMVLNAYQSEISGIQSIIKFMQQGEITEAIKNKYIYS